MQVFTSRAARRPLARTLIVLGAAALLGACADEPTAPKLPATLAPQASALPGEWVDVTVTNTSGGTDVGSVRWAANQIESGGGVIRFAPALDGATIVLNGPL